MTIEPVGFIGFRELNQHLGMAAHIAKPQCREFVYIRGEFPVGPENQQAFVLVEPDPEVEGMPGHVNLAIIGRLMIDGRIVENFRDFFDVNVIKFNNLIQYVSPDVGAMIYTQQKPWIGFNDVWKPVNVRNCGRR